jgi:hypothetical protein
MKVDDCTELGGHCVCVLVCACVCVCVYAQCGKGAHNSPFQSEICTCMLYAAAVPEHVTIKANDRN